jgi:hypothetical protein
VVLIQPAVEMFVMLYVVFGCHWSSQCYWGHHKRLAFAATNTRALRGLVGRDIASHSCMICTKAG